MAELRDTAEVTGLTALGRDLANLDINMKEKVATSTVLTAEQTSLTAVQTEVPIRTGNLFRNIKIARRKDSIDNTQVQYVIFVKSGPRPKPKLGRKRIPNKGDVYPYYWVFVEFGTSRQAANPFMLRGFQKSAGNAATRARDRATYLVNKHIGKGKS